MPPEFYFKLDKDLLQNFIIMGTKIIDNNERLFRLNSRVILQNANTQQTPYNNSSGTSTNSSSSMSQPLNQQSGASASL